MIALLAALLTAASPSQPSDVVFTPDGGRIAGTVIEEGPTSGVTIQLPDGSIRRLEPAQVSRVEFADGTVSTPRAPLAVTPAAARAQPSEGPLDNVYLVGGGRVRGTVMEESARTGVKVRLLDGSVQTYPREDLVRIEYADGSVSRRVARPAPRAAAPVVPEPAAPAIPQPVAQPAPYAYPQSPPAFFPPPGPEARRPPYPVYLALGVGASFLGGEAARDVAMSQVVKTEQGHVSGELGFRLSPSLAIGVYGDMTGGDPAPALRDACQAQGLDCMGTTAHAGFLVRHTWAPASTRPTWLSLGTGWEAGGVVVDRHGTGGASELVRYKGREWLRLGTGVDFRSSDVLALGLYATFSVGEYDSYEDATGITSSIDQATQHTTAQVGLRLTLFP